jgi:hypothetical protein
LHFCQIYGKIKATEDNRKGDNMDKQEKVYGWHFAQDNGRLGYGDGREIVVGETLSVKGDIIPCINGLHGSTDIFDALSYAPGNMICWCEFSGEIIHHPNKLAASHRTVLWMIDGESLLRKFACDEALRVLPNDADPVIRQYLETQGETIRDAAWDAAWYAARSAAGSAARDKYRKEQKRRLLCMLKDAGWNEDIR